MAYERAPQRYKKGFTRSKVIKEEEQKGLGITPRGTKKTKLAFGVTPTDVTQAKKKRPISVSQQHRAKSQRSSSAQKMADVEAGVSKQVRKRETGTAKPWTPKTPQWKTRLTKLIKSLSLPKGVVGKAVDIVKNADSPIDSDKFEQLLNKMTSGNSKGGTVSRKGGGTVKKQVGGLPQGYDARLRESLAARHPAVRGNLAARAAESEGMERALGRRPYAAVRTMDRSIKKGGSVRRKKGGTISRKSGGKIMVGYKAGGKV